MIILVGTFLATMTHIMKSMKQDAFNLSMKKDKGWPPSFVKRVKLDKHTLDKVTNESFIDSVLVKTDKFIENLSTT